jgi:ribosomal protein S18 acetylase RimI-like enzyme
LLYKIQNDALERALRSPNHVSVGPFVMRYDERWNSPFANYAIPLAGTQACESDIARLDVAFADRDRRPRLEYLSGAAPALEATLLAAGYRVENRAAVMLIEAGDPVPAFVTEGIDVRPPADEAEFRAIAALQHAAYAEDGEVSESQINWLRNAAADGGLVLAAVANDSQIVGAGLCSAPRNGLAELTGLAVSLSWRRAGIGSALSARLTEYGLARGYSAIWLEPGDEKIQRMYARVGYRVIGEKLNISRPV